jgi:protein-L-isoaspartate O-methyltransferase
MLQPDYPKLLWGELKQLVLEHYSPEPLCELAEVLRRHHYERIARVPACKDILSGLPREAFLLLNNLWGSTYRLFSMSAFPALHRSILDLENPELGYLFRVIFLNAPTTRSKLRQKFPDPLIDRLIEIQALVEENGLYRFTLSFVPFKHLLLARDPFHVYLRDPSQAGDKNRRVWLGSDSILFAHFLDDFFSRHRFQNVLEIGAGSGIQILIAAPHADRAIGVDINRRALAFSRINAQINRVDNVEFIPSNLFENCDEKFDLILANPWYCDLKSGGLEEIPGILDGLDDHLRENGMLAMLTSSYLKAGHDTVLERLKNFVRERGNYDLDAKVVGYGIDTAEYAQFKKYGIFCSLDYLLTLRKNGTGKIQVRDVGLVRRLRDFSYIRVARALENMRTWGEMH